jgi:hypothetical protein
MHREKSLEARELKLKSQIQVLQEQERLEDSLQRQTMQVRGPVRAYKH